MKNNIKNEIRFQQCLKEGRRRAVLNNCIRLTYMYIFLNVSIVKNNIENGIRFQQGCTH